mmetsp:Transcript_19644/g.30210  ORF Transcript_19644/g.30210 Transcript_19644/m.30210 type:complete len:379 (-) Transcript_19644:33-1169(-)
MNEIYFYGGDDAGAISVSSSASVSHHHHHHLHRPSAHYNNRGTDTNRIQQNDGDDLTTSTFFPSTEAVVITSSQSTVVLQPHYTNKTKSVLTDCTSTNTNNLFDTDTDNHNDVLFQVDDYLASVRTAITEQDCFYKYNGPLHHPDKLSSQSSCVDAAPISNDDNKEELGKITEHPESSPPPKSCISSSCIDQSEAHQVLEKLDGLLQRLDLQQLEHDKAERGQHNYQFKRRNGSEVLDVKQEQSHLLSSRKSRSTRRKTKAPEQYQIPSAQQTIQIYFRGGETQGSERNIERTSDCATTGNCGYSTIPKNDEGYSREETQRREPEFETSTNCATADSLDFVASKASQSLRQNDAIMPEPNICNEGSSDCATADSREYM